MTKTCRNCGHELRQTRSAPTTSGRGGRVTQYRCDGCGHGGERYDSGLQFGPVFRPRAYATQIAAARSGTSIDHDTEPVANSWEAVADD